MISAVSLHIGVTRSLDWGGGVNHKSHAMTSSEIFKRGFFLWDRDTIA